MIGNLTKNSLKEEKSNLQQKKEKLVLQDGNAIKIKMKVKRDVAEDKFGETLIELQEIEGTDGETTIKSK